MTSIQENNLYRLTGFSLLLFAVAGLISDGIGTSVAGLLHLQLHSARLLTDYTVVGGTGGALLNAAIMGLLALTMVRFSQVSLSGPTMAAIFTIAGFSLFGKTPANSLPIVLGVYLASLAARKPFSHYLLMALFGTALGPLVSFVTSESGLPLSVAVPVGITAGAAAGFVLPALAMAMLRMHEGFNLYNIGFSCGFLALFAASLFAALQHDLPAAVIWNSQPNLALTLLVPSICILFIAQGVGMDGMQAGRHLRKIIGLSGRLPTDFMSMVSPGAALINAGLTGLVAVGYLLLIGADFNGPVLGGLLTLVGFSTFGKHPRNCGPVALGIVLSSLLLGKPLTDPGPLLALLFGTTLAPLAGEFGPLTGIGAGMVHLVMVEQTAAWHGGIDLYNNGFAGGLTATLFVAIIQWARAGKPARHEPKPNPAPAYYGDRHE